MNNNWENLHKEIKWFLRCTETRMLIHNREVMEDRSFQCIEDHECPELTSDESEFGKFINENKLNYAERLFLVISLIPHVDISLVDQLIDKSNASQMVFLPDRRIYLPSGLTPLFLLAGNETIKRLSFHYLYDSNHLFYQKGIIDFGARTEGYSEFSGVIKMNRTYVDLFLKNKHSKPRFSTEFPAHLLTTELEWEDLILNESTRKKIEELKSYLDHHETLRNEWGLGKHFSKGYRCTFWGPSGTGKTLTASLLGKHIGTDVYRVDLSNVVSKYIGETSKNLGKLFDTAEDKGWILFFDEGDALFGKRVENNQEDKNAHYANQDIAFLLQRIENYNGLVIVATNLKQNMDDAFARRFQSSIQFTIPDDANRMKIWQNHLPKHVPLASNINLEHTVQKYKMPAANIHNIINKACLLTIQKGNSQIEMIDLEQAIRDEIKK